MNFNSIDGFVVVGESTIKCAKLLNRLFKTKNVHIHPFYSDPYEPISKHPEYERDALSMLSLYGIRKCRSLFYSYNSASVRSCYQPSTSFNNFLKNYSYLIDKHGSLFKPMNGRYYFPNLSRNGVLAYCDMIYKYYEDVINTYKPKFFLDPYPNSLSRVVLQGICKEHGIPYLSIVHSRFKDYITVVDDFVWPGSSLRKISGDIRFSEFRVGTQDAENQLQDFLASSSYLNNDEKAYEASFSSISLLQLLKSIVVGFVFTLNMMIGSFASVKSLDCFLVPFYRQITPAGFLPFFYNLMISIRSYIRVHISWLTSRKISDLPDDFIYFPFAYTAEGDSLFSRGIFDNDRNLFDLMLLLRGNSQDIVLKEHRSMLGERHFSESRYFSAWKNVLYVSSISPDFRDPKLLLNACSGLISISGTSGFEGMMLGKPTLIMGNPIYYDFLNLPSKKLSETDKIRKFYQDPEYFCVPLSEIVSYIHASMSFGISIPYTMLLSGDFNLEEANADDLHKLVALIIKLADF